MKNEYVKRKYVEVAKWVKKNSSVLDVGCDQGELRNYLPSVIYYGLEVDKTSITKLKKKKIHVFERDLNKDKISLGKKFDYIIILDILEHLLDPAKVIRELKKHLTKNGKMIISLPNDYHFLNKFRFLMNKCLVDKPFWQYGHLHIFPIKAGEEYLKDNSLRILRTVILYPNKPRLIPNPIKKVLAQISPNNFSRGKLYLVESKSSPLK